MTDHAAVRDPHFSFPTGQY